MGDKDFAEGESSQFPTEAMPDTVNHKPLIITAIALAGVVVSFGSGFYFGEQYGIEISKSHKNIQLVETLKSQQQELTSLKEEAKAWRQHEASTSQVGELTFYNELPKQSIMPEPIQAPNPISPSTPIRKAHQKHPDLNNEKDDIKAVAQRLETIIQQELNASARSFRIQVASFKSRHDAEAFLPKLQSIGIPSTIQRVELPNIGVWYRVYSPRFSKEKQAIHTKLALKKELNITGIMIQDD